MGRNPGNARTAARLRIVCGTTLAMVATLGALSGTARAQDPIDIQFDNAVIQLGGTSNPTNYAFIRPTGQRVDTLELFGDSNASTGLLTAPVFDFPIPAGADQPPGVLEVEDLEITAPVTGSFTSATGQLTLSASLIAKLESGSGECVIPIGPVTLSTETRTPLPGTRYPAGSSFAPSPTPVDTVFGPNGALAGSWDTLPDGTGPGCGTANPLAKGPGGLWLSHGVAPPAVLGVVALPGTEKVRGGRVARFRVLVGNTGASAASNVRVCASSPRKARRQGPSCDTLGTVPAGDTESTAFGFQTRSRSRGTAAVRFTVTANGQPRSTVRTSIRIRR